MRAALSVRLSPRSRSLSSSEDLALLRGAQDGQSTGARCLSTMRRALFKLRIGNLSPEDMH